MKATISWLAALCLVAGIASVAQAHPLFPRIRRAPDPCGLESYCPEPDGAGCRRKCHLLSRLLRSSGGTSGFGQASSGATSSFGQGPSFPTHPYARSPRDYFMVD
jgi:hypothetical protein